jgi:glutamine amidotransferase
MYERFDEKPMISIIDYDAGNIRSVEKALKYLGKDAVITKDRDVILSSDHVILPGVGSFGDAMNKLRSYKLDNTIYDVVEKGIPFLGICLGLQLLYESSEESSGVSGLGILKGKILRIPEAEGLKIPHMGWNSLDIKESATLFKNIKENPYVYFVHSYYLRADDENEVMATTNYSVNIHASVERGNVFACQFHPEKSGSFGLGILDNFIKVPSGT